MRRFALAVASLMAIALVPVVSSAVPNTVDKAGGSDIRELDRSARRKLQVTEQTVDKISRLAAQQVAAAPPVVGEERVWLAIDDVEGAIYPKAYTLRGIGNHIEVWVASDEDDISTGTDFPAGDCRNDGVRNVVSDEQVNYLIDQFDNTMYPIESDAFSVGPLLDGRGAPLTEILDLPRGYYRGPGDRIVALIDNVRDENFYDTDNSQGLTYVAGFYFSTFDFYFNRQVMTIDAFDWPHRTGANPPHEPSSDLCENAPARPFLYEGVFAHEYQHLLENYVDFDETNWVNEGLSDYAQTITGYVDPSLPITDVGFDSHIQCFLGYNNQVTNANPIPREGGPENSLTLWGDQIDFESEVLCDYGAAYSMMEYLAARYGEDFMRDLHLLEPNGLDSVAQQLAALGDEKVLDIVAMWATMVAVDGALDDGFSLIGGAEADFTTPTLDASINWSNDQAYAGPGVPPNGSDYVRFRNDADAFLGAGAVDSVSFNGASKLPKLPVEWKVDRNAPGPGKRKALYSGKGDNLDRAIVRQVRVGQGNLEFDTIWDTESGYDYAYVQVSTNGGKRYRSVRCTDSVNAPLGPGFEGESGGFVHQECNLSRYAGDRVHLAFRYVTDGSVQFDGFWVDDIVLDGREISDGRTLQGWKSPTQINPVAVKRWVVRLVAIDETTQQVRIGTIPLDENFDGTLEGATLDDIIGTTGSTVAAIVTFLDRSENVLQTAPYSLTVNGVEQPGG
jgi:Immune inhibitor A peptidase M6